MSRRRDSRDRSSPVSRGRNGGLDGEEAYPGEQGYYSRDEDNDSIISRDR